MRRIAYIALGAALLASTSLAGSQKKSGAETTLLGIHLYDSGVKVVSMYGTPDSVEPINIGGSTTTGGGAPGGFAPGGPQGGGPGGGAPAGAPRGSGPGPGAPSADPMGFGFGNDMLRQSMSPPSNLRPASGPPGAGGPGPAGGGGGNSGGGPNFPPGVGPGAGAPGGSTNNTQSNKVIFTRWVYNRAGCKYGFIFDKQNRVVQIEAIGLSNPRVHTRRGIGFGANFAQIIKKYSKSPDGSADAPDGYEITGDTLVVRYLVKDKVAFRLSRLGKDKPQVVTGVVVAAGKI